MQLNNAIRYIVSQPFVYWVTMSCDDDDDDGGGGCDDVQCGDDCDGNYDIDEDDNILMMVMMINTFYKLIILLLFQ